jgi:serine/threonine-protein kinase HipA
LIDNQDDHAKNFSFVFDDINKTYRLSPAYDITPGKTYYGEHTTSVNGKGKNITEDDMLKVAMINKIDLISARNIIEKCKCVIKE